LGQGQDQDSVVDQLAEDQVQATEETAAVAAAATSTPKAALHRGGRNKIRSEEAVADIGSTETEEKPENDKLSEETIAGAASMNEESSKLDVGVAPSESVGEESTLPAPEAKPAQPKHRKRKWGSTAAVGKKGDGDEVVEGKSAALKRSASHAIDSDLLKNLIPDIATASLPPLPASAITGSSTTLAASVAEANGAKLGPTGLLVQPETTSVADLLEISAPSIDTLENEDAGEGEEDEEDEKKREMKGIRRTVLREDAEKEEGEEEEGRGRVGDEEKENEAAITGDKRRKVVDGAVDRKRSKRDSEDNEREVVDERATIQRALGRSSEDTTKKKTPLGVLLSDEPVARKKKEPSPPRFPPSTILHIKGLTRPFTIPQLQILLNRTGKLKTDEFWIDKIKSHCLAMYETVEEAEATRSALHGTQWPASNPKSLRVDFSKEDQLKRFQISEDSAPGYKKEAPPPPPVEPRREVTRNRSVERQPARPKEKEEKPKPREARSRSRDRERRPSTKDRGPPRARSPAVREWDRDKIRQSRSPTPSGREAHAKSSPPPQRRARSPAEARKPSRSPRPVDVGTDRRERRRSSPAKEIKEAAPPPEEEPAKLLDNLFNKTKAQPHIYWLPLTDQQVVERVAERERRRLEKLKAREEMQKEADKVEKKRKEDDEKRREEKRKSDEATRRPARHESRSRSRSRDRRH